MPHDFFSHHIMIIKRHSLQRGNALALLQGTTDARNAVRLSSILRPHTSTAVVERIVTAHTQRRELHKSQVVAQVEFKVTTTSSGKDVITSPILPPDHSSSSVGDQESGAPYTRTATRASDSVSVVVEHPGPPVVGAEGGLSGSATG